MDQLGHSDPRMTLGVYAKVMMSGEDERERLRVLVEGGSVGQTENPARAEGSVRA